MLMWYICCFIDLDIWMHACLFWMAVWKLKGLPFLLYWTKYMCSFKMIKADGFLCSWRRSHNSFIVKRMLATALKHPLFLSFFLLIHLHPWIFSSTLRAHLYCQSETRTYTLENSINPQTKTLFLDSSWIAFIYEYLVTSYSFEVASQHCHAL